MFINLFTAPGLLGSPQRFHLSVAYRTKEQATRGSYILPDAGWKFIQTIEVEEFEDMVCNSCGDPNRRPLTEKR